MAKQHDVIANVDAISAPELIYPQAVYLHNGESFFVRELDQEGRVAYVERHEMDYYTQAILESSVTITDKRERSDVVAQAGLEYGNVDVSWKTVAFKKIKFSTRENIGFGSVDIPAQNLPTTAFWLTPDDEVRSAMKSRGLRTSEAIAGLRNLAVVALPMVAMCDSRDISGVVDSKNLGKSCMILYDRYPGGLGYCEKGYHHIHQLLSICHDLVAQCECEDGCPSCVGLPNLRPAIHSDPERGDAAVVVVSSGAGGGAGVGVATIWVKPRSYPQSVSYISDGAFCSERRAFTSVVGYLWAFHRSYGRCRFNSFIRFMSVRHCS
jgi:DEAD/DEAH box helicase domain-containing protein